MLLDTWSNSLALAFTNLWSDIITYIPNILIAILLFVVGWVFGDTVGGWIAKVIRSLKVDKVLEGLDIHNLLARAGYRLDTGAFVGALFKWFVIIIFLIAAMDVLNLTQINIFLQNVLAYLPNVIVAVIILILAAVIADVTQKVVVASSRAAHVSSAELFGGIAKWVIWIFGILFAMDQLSLGGPFLQILLTGAVATISIALGLSFGLGGRDAAAEFIAKLRSEISRRS